MKRPGRLELRTDGRHAGPEHSSSDYQDYAAGEHTRTGSGQNTSASLAQTVR